MRLFWHATACGAGPSGKVTGWFLTQSNKKYACYHPKDQNLHSAHSPYDIKSRVDSHAHDVYGNAENEKEDEDIQDEEGEPVAWRRAQIARLANVMSSKQMAASQAVVARENDTFLEDMRMHPDLSSADRSLAKSEGAAAHKAVGGNCIVSLTGDRGMEVSHEAMRDVSYMKVSRKALGEPHLYVERLVSWLQVVIQHSSDVIVHFSDVVCDFIRDEEGRWWLLQLKSFRVSPLSAQRCEAWYNERMKNIPRPRRITPEETRAKLDAERGRKCKLCGLNFQDGQTVEVETDVDAEVDQTDVTPAKSSVRGHFPQKTRTVPAFGYELSRRMACRISEIYRDANFPLTKFARAVLTGEARVMEARTVAEKLRELEVLELKRSTGGELTCCYLCFQNMEEYTKVQDCSRDLQFLVKGSSGDTSAANAAGASNAKEEGGRAGRKGREKCRHARSPSPVYVSGAIKQHDKLEGKLSDTKQPVERTLTGDQHAVPVTNVAARALIGSVIALYKRHPNGLTSCSYGKLAAAVEPVAGASLSIPPALDLPSAKRELALSWTAIPRKACQWRMMVALHYISECTLPALHPLHGRVGCFSYSLGQSVSTLPFVNVQRATSGQIDNPLVFVRQMRVHYFFGRTSDVRDFLAEKKLHFMLCFQPADDLASTLPVAAAATQSVAARMPRLESQFSVALSSLNLRSSGLQDGSLKVEFQVPLTFESLEPATLRLSVALVRDDVIPGKVVEVSSFCREGEVFWPSASYHDSAPLPEAWLGLLTGRAADPPSMASAPGEKDPLLAKESSETPARTAGIISSAVASEDDTTSSVEAMAQTRLLVKNTFARLVRERLLALEVAQAAHAASKAENEFAAMLTSRPSTRDMGSPKSKGKGVSLQRRARNSDDDSSAGSPEEEDDEAGDTFDMPTAPRPVAVATAEPNNHGSDDSSNSDYDMDDELPLYTVVQGLFQIVRVEEQDANKSGTRDEDGTAAKVVREASVLLRLALEQLLLQENLPETCSLTNFSYILEECLLWARTQRMVVLIANRDDADGEETAGSRQQQGGMGKLRYLTNLASKKTSTGAPAMATATPALGDASGAQALGREWVMNAERIVYSLSMIYPRTDLDVEFTQGELTSGGRLKSTMKELSQRGAGVAQVRRGPEDRSYDLTFPSSLKRKLRRFMLALSLFELAGAGAETVDVAAVRAHLQLERERLRKMLSLTNEGAMSWPLLRRDYHVYLPSPFLQERAVMALHLLRYSDTMQMLFDRYDTQGTASISKTGFLSASEEAFRGVTQRKSVFLQDEVMQELEAFCTDRSMQAQSHNTSLRRNTFTLGLGSPDSNATGMSDLSQLGARRRISQLGSNTQSLHEPPTLWVRCDEHGIERAFAADFMCIKCEEEWHGYRRGQDYVQVGTAAPVVSSQDKNAADSRGGTSTPGRSSGTTRRKSSFAFH